MTLAIKTRLKTLVFAGIAVIGDTQGTTFLERLAGRENNPTVPAELIQSIANEKPTAVVHLGDAVTCGGCPAWMPDAIASSWPKFEKDWAPVKALQIPLHLAYGNHDYWFSSKIRDEGVRRNFPDTPTGDKPRYRTLLTKGTAWILLDSDIDEMTGSAWKAQIAWAEKEVAKLEANAGIRAIVFVSHHPPFSNSDVTGDSKWMQDGFLPAFRAAKKTVLWLSGHAHGYEHFRIIEESAFQKHFVVSGGGGGPRVKYDSPLRHEDLFEGPRPRPFNYLMIEEWDQSLQVTVKGMPAAGGAITVLDRFEIKY